MAHGPAKAKQSANFVKLALLALTLSVPASALDPLCAPTTNLGIPKCPESSTDWFESYSVLIDTTDLVLGGIADINGIKGGLSYTSPTFSGMTSFLGPLFSGTTPALSLDCDSLEGVIGHKVSSGLWTGGSCSSLPTGDAVRAATQTFSGENTMDGLTTFKDQSVFDGEVIFNSTVTFAGFGAAIPSGSIIIFKSTPCPEGFTFDAGFDARFPIGFDSPTPSHALVPDFPGVNGGADNHLHTGTTDGVAGNNADPGTTFTAALVNGQTFTTNATTEYPRFLTVAFCTKD